MTALYNLNEDYKYYENCYEMSRESVDKFIPYDTHILLTGKDTDPYDMLKDVYLKTIEQVRKGNNVLFIEIDCIVVKPCPDIFNFDKMMMFSRTEPWSLKYKDKMFDPYMNSGVRFFPATIPEDILFKAGEMVLDYDKSYWGYDQTIYNMIYHSQHEVTHFNHEIYNYIPFPKFLKNIKEEDAHIIHLFTSRGAKECRDRMKIHYERFVK